MIRPDRDAYLRRHRRMLLDMHIPDWDEAFLASVDPKELVRCYELARVDAVMLYCKSHVGLCYWPTTVGKQHGGAGGDFVGEMVRLLHERDILVCAYTSVAYDRYAVEADPDLAVVPAGGSTGWPRWSVVCLNKRRYVDYERALYTELLSSYDFDAFFLDMAFWPAICVCDDCRERLRAEEQMDIPTHLDWASPDWTRFQAARERWADEFMQELIAHAEALVDVPIYHNFAASFTGFVGGLTLHAFRNDAFLGADLTGGRDEQLFATKLMRATSPNLPGEYMTPRAPTLQDHVSVKPEREMTLQALGSLALGSAVLFIDAIDPDGRVDPDLYEQIGRVNEHYQAHEHLFGGDHIEDVGVYYSSESFVDLGQSGIPIGSVEGGRSAHLDAAVGAVRGLQQAHVATGVVTYRQLDELSRYKVLVVGDLSRITTHEAEAFRSYVADGGSLYASGRTSLLSVDGTRHEDFLLADVFGVRYDGDESGTHIFLRPTRNETADAIDPQRFVGFQIEPGGTPRVSALASANLLATLSLPYAYPAQGTNHDSEWASIYSYPPWTHTSHATVVENAFGTGRAIYTPLPLERDAQRSSRSVFRSLIEQLLGSRATIAADAHPAVWIETFHQPAASRYVVHVLNYPADFEPIPTDVSFRLVLPNGEIADQKLHLELFESVVVPYGR